MKTIPDLYQRTIASLNYGYTQEELSARLSECVARVQETGRQGKITFTITIKPAGGRDGQIEITESIKANLPELDRGKTLMFVTPEGNLQRDNPKQPDLDNLRSIDDDHCSSAVSA